jgi:hypothetical protein
VPSRRPVGSLLRKLVAGLLLGVYGLLAWRGCDTLTLGGLGGVRSEGLGRLSEAESVAVFRQHRDACDGIRLLVLGDERTTAICDLDHDDRRERRRAVERLLAEIGGHRVTGDMRQGRDRTCEIHLAWQGSFFGGCSASFVFSPDERPTDNPPRDDDPDFCRHTDLGGGWYLRYQTQ